MTDSLTLAGRVAAKLNYTTDDLVEFCSREGNEEFDGCPDNIDFCRHLDRMIFMCIACEYWKPQHENATPDASEWKCQECARDEANAEAYAKNHPRD